MDYEPPNSDQISAFNGKMAVSSARTPGVKFEILHGFWRDPRGELLPMSSWAGDDVDMGFRKYQWDTRWLLLIVVWLSWTVIFATKIWVVSNSSRYLTNQFGPLSTAQLGTPFTSSWPIRINYLNIRHTWSFVHGFAFKKSCIMPINHSHFMSTYDFNIMQHTYRVSYYYYLCNLLWHPFTKQVIWNTLGSCWWIVKQTYIWLFILGHCVASCTDPCFVSVLNYANRCQHWD